MNERSSTSKRAILISLEGADGLGKSTQAGHIKKALEATSKKVAIAKLPAYETFTGKIISRMLKNGTAVRHPNIFQTFQWLDKQIFQITKLKKLVRENDFVLLDRWHASMWAYGLAGGANEKLTNYYVDSIREPHAILVFYGSCKRSGADDSYEANQHYQKSVALHYVLWSCIRSNNSFPINADQPIQIITQEALAAIYSIC
jgi:thymidylate kinase